MANKRGRRKYTAGQKKAYYSGMGYRAGRSGKRMRFRNARNRRSFSQGYRDAAR